MSAQWRTLNLQVFIRDIVRDYCKVHVVLMEQSQRYAHSGTISYAVLRDLLGDAMRKGVLWRVKDAAHHLFRTPIVTADGLLPTQSHCRDKKKLALYEPEAKETTPTNTLANLLDWCMGFVFHECVKLKEDAFQRQHYTNRLLQMHLKRDAYEGVINDLLPFSKQTHESIGREIERIMGVLLQIRHLLILFLEDHKQNQHIARLLVEDYYLVKQGFGDHFNELLQVLYADKPHTYFVLALSLALESGRVDKARRIIETAKDEQVHVDIIDEMQGLMAKHAQSA